MKKVYECKFRRPFGGLVGYQRYRWGDILVHVLVSRESCQDWTVRGASAASTSEKKVATNAPPIAARAQRWCVPTAVEGAAWVDANRDPREKGYRRPFKVRKGGIPRSSSRKLYSCLCCCRRTILSPRSWN